MTVEIHETGDWTLRVRDGVVEAAKPIPYDGVLTYSTRDRPNSRRKNSQFRMHRRDVVQAYVGYAAPDADADDLLALVEAALATGGSA